MTRSSFFVSSAGLLCAWLVPGLAQAEVLVSPEEVHQRIDGFGASSAFFGNDIPESEIEFLFSEETGIGLSLLRMLIDSREPIAPELETAMKAQEWGARIWAQAFSPPAEWKSNESVLGGGGTWPEGVARLLDEHYDDFAEYLADYAEYVQSAGIDLYALSPSHFPDFAFQWDGCEYTPDEVAKFLGQHLGPEFESRGIDVQLAAPDTALIHNLPAYMEALQNDPEAMRFLDIVATEPYNNLDDYSLEWRVPEGSDLSFWQTEWSLERYPYDTPANGMDGAFGMLELIHQHLTEWEVNAWHYWQLQADYEEFEQSAGQLNPALVQGNDRYKRAYALGNFSKFVRPGFERIGAHSPTDSALWVSAFRGENRYVIVAINPLEEEVTETFALSSQARVIEQLVPWITSDIHELEEQAPIAFSAEAASFEYSLPSQSVTSFVFDLEPEPQTGTGGQAAEGSGGESGAEGTGASNGHQGNGSSAGQQVSTDGGAPSSGQPEADVPTTSSSGGSSAPATRRTSNSSGGCSWRSPRSPGGSGGWLITLVGSWLIVCRRTPSEKSSRTQPQTSRM